MPIVFRFVSIFFVCEKFNIFPVSLFKCVWSHASEVLCLLCIACINCCLVYNVLTRSLVLQWACVLVPTVTVLWTNVLWLAFPNYACVVACDNWLNVTHATCLLTVYKATINTGNTQDRKHYIGGTSNTFKEWYRNHVKSFTHKKYSNETELLKHVWHLKPNNRFHHNGPRKWSQLKS